MGATNTNQAATCPAGFDHDALKADAAAFSQLAAPRRGAYVVLDYGDGGPLELQEHRNCACKSTLVRSTSSDEAAWSFEFARSGLSLAVAA